MILDISVVKYGSISDLVNSREGGTEVELTISVPDDLKRIVECAGNGQYVSPKDAIELIQVKEGKSILEVKELYPRWLTVDTGEFYCLGYIDVNQIRGP